MARTIEEVLAKISACDCKLPELDIQNFYLNTIGAIYESITRGGTTAIAPSNVSVGVATTAVLTTNASRRGLILVNDSANIIYLAFGSPAELNKGIRLNPNGGSYTMTAETFNLQTVNAIATGAASNLTIQEFE